MNKQDSTVTSCELRGLDSLGDVWNDVVQHFPVLSVLSWQRDGVDAAAMQFMPGPPPALSFPADAPATVFSHLLVTRPVSCALVARGIGCSFAALTPALLRTYIFLHECGHAYDFVVNFAPFWHGKDAESDPRFVDACLRSAERQECEVQSLPLPLTPAGFLSARTEQPAYIDALLLERLHITTPTASDYDRALEALEYAYKKLPSEVFADAFAVSYFQSHPSLLSFSPAS